MISGGSTKNTEKIDFTITNKGDEAEGLSLEVLDGNEVIYSEQQTGKYFIRESMPGNGMATVIKAYWIQLS